MRAIVQRGYARPEPLVLRDWPDPEVRPGGLLLRVTACGANASDWEVITGTPAYARLTRRFRGRETIPGSDVAGVVEALGAGVTGFAPGDRVVADLMEHWGGFAERVAAPASRFVKIPPGVSDVDAAALPQSGTIALKAMERVLPGQRVLVNGAGGGSGPLAIQLAVARGGVVTAVDNAGKAEVMRAAGAAEVMDHAHKDFTRTGATWDVILDLYGTRPMRAIRPCLRPGGRYMMVGGPMRAFWSAVGGTLRGADRQGRRAGLLIVPQGPARLPELLAMVEAGTLRPVIGAVVPLADTPGALAAMGAGEIAGKLVVTP
ncbi:NAD(P)-dependent alcohol dehydrogenase [Pseudoroseicyclus sp. CXY001]|uniref:NAD(P)-dependent alcohol dehydrogenase n=1 Tax=Pseudoroseicyclus sp. CXY001 TaxID=3242492 RepID=UPI003570C4D0